MCVSHSFVVYLIFPSSSLSLPSYLLSLCSLSLFPPSLSFPFSLSLPLSLSPGPLFLFSSFSLSLLLSPFLLEGFGNYTRIDYGTGHEAKFMAFLCCLMQIRAIPLEDKEAVVLRVAVK